MFTAEGTLNYVPDTFIAQHFPGLVERQKNSISSLSVSAENFLWASTLRLF